MLDLIASITLGWKGVVLEPGGSSSESTTQMMSYFTVKTSEILNNLGAASDKCYN